MGLFSSPIYSVSDSRFYVISSYLGRYSWSLTYFKNEVSPWDQIHFLDCELYSQKRAALFIFIPASSNTKYVKFCLINSP